MIRPYRLKSSLNIFALLAVGGAANAAPQNSSKLVPMPNTVLPVVSKSTQALFQPASAAKIEVAISLKPRDSYGLQAFADAVSDPSSPMYRHFISPEEVGSRYGASPKDVYAVKDFLTKGGLTVTHVGKNNVTIAATGTRDQVEALFATVIGDFNVTDESGTVNYRANITPLKVPSSLVDKIQSINGVESYTRPRHRTTELTPPLTRTLYGIAPLFTAGFKGSGRTVGISSWDGFRLTNGNLFITKYGLPVPVGGPMSNVSVVTVGTGTGSGTANGEGDLDFQMVLGTAPLANIIIYDGTGGNLTTVLSTEASANTADIITESYGWAIDVNTANACHTTHLAMAAQGITYMCASGDNGTQLGPYDYPDYDPEVMMVGGTDATTDGAGNRIAEPTWSGGGGGWCVGSDPDASPFNVRPSWQVGNGVPSASIVNKRLVPDVSLHATDYAIFIGGNLAGIGGTSASSPAFAGGLAVVEQRLFAATNKARLGRLQNKIYAENGRPDVWFDVKTGPSIGALPSTGGGSLNNTQANPTVGWDFASGWGAVNFNAFYTTLLSTVADPIPFYAQGVTPVAGTYVSGTRVSLNLTDGNVYTMQSVPMRGIGQVLGFNAVYVCPFTNIATLQLSLGVTGPLGASVIVLVQNVVTGAYDQISSIGLTGSLQSKTIGFTTSQIPTYVHTDGSISLIIRAVSPARVGQTPGVMTVTCDKAAFAAAKTGT